MLSREVASDMIASRISLPYAAAATTAYIAIALEVVSIGVSEFQTKSSFEKSQLKSYFVHTHIAESVRCLPKRVQDDNITCGERIIRLEDPEVHRFKSDPLGTHKSEWGWHRIGGSMWGSSGD
jgi:hypothetical protein